MRSNKKFLIELPLKIALTEDGASNFISHNKKLMRFKLADNVEEYGIAFSRKNKSLRDKVQKTLLEMQADGTVAKISTKWFGSDISTIGK